MPYNHISFKLPDYEKFANTIKPLSLDLTPSELHGVMSGYICAGATSKGEQYLRTLVQGKKDEAEKKGVLEIFDLYTITQHQIINFDPELQLLLPEDKADLKERAKSFSEWCNGFMDGLTMAGINLHTLEEQDAQNALLHISQFSDLNYEDLSSDEDDEKALMEVSEYTRMAILHLHNIITSDDDQTNKGRVSH